MDKKIILITGASGGIGRALTDWFSSKGEYMVIAHSNHNSSSVLANEHTVGIEGDLSTEIGVKKVMECVFSITDHVDVLINNAGVSHSAMSWKQSVEEWRKTMAVNLDAPFLLSKAVLPKMRENQFGRIVNISSVVAQTGAIGTAAYAASKAGLIGLTKTMAKEVATNGITVNALALGYFETGMITDVPDEQLQQIISTIPLGKLGSTQAICSTIDWLLGDEAGYITGQVINLNGGMH